MDTKEYTERPQSRRNNPFLVGFAIACIIAMWLFLFIITAFDLRAYSRDATAVNGKLEDVIWNYDRTLDLCIDGDTYTLSKDNLYSSRSFGVLNDMPLSKLVDVLDAYTGQKVSIEYVPLALEKNGIVELTVDGGIEIVNKDIAVEDFICRKRHSIIRGSVFFLTVIGLFIFALECRK